MFNKYAPEVVIRRLPKYYSQLTELESENVERISSLQLSKRMGLNASQIRQDLNYFGEFGQQGYGYIVDDLKRNIAAILGLHRDKEMVVVGCGNIGTALARYKGFNDVGFKVVALFDASPQTIGTKIGEMVVRSADELQPYLEENPIDIGVICTPREVAQNIANVFDAAGTSGVWNFTNTDLLLENSVVEDVRLSDSLFVLNYNTEHGIFD